MYKDLPSMFLVIKATIVKEELKFGDESMGIPFPLQKNYTVQFKKRDIFKVLIYISSHIMRLLVK